MASMFPAPVSPPAPQAAPCGLLTYAALTTATIGWAECLGSGSYGAVYAGVLNGERVAVKRFRQKDSGTDSFLREVAVAALVQHPHVLRVVAMSVDHECHLCLAYPRLEGGSLWDRLVSRTACPLSASQRAQVALCAARGMAAMHSARQVHHDIKSGNVLLSAGHNSAVLADCGASYSLVAVADSCYKETVPTDNLLYPCWAPEFVSHGIVHPPCDVYAFGVMLCELISGKPATMPRTAAEGIVCQLRPALAAGQPERVADEAARWPGPLLRAFGKLATQCLSPSPELRPTAVEVVVCLHAACAAAGLGPPPPAFDGWHAPPEAAPTPRAPLPALVRVPSGDGDDDLPAAGAKRKAVVAAAASRQRGQRRGEGENGVSSPRPSDGDAADAGLSKRPRVVTTAAAALQAAALAVCQSLRPQAQEAALPGSFQDEAPVA